MQVLILVKNYFFLGIIMTIVLPLGLIAAIIFCMKLLWLYHHTPFHKCTVKNLCDDVLRTVRIASYEQDVDARWISEDYIIIRVEQTYHTKHLTHNRAKAIQSIIRHWVNIGILDTRIVQKESGEQLVYTVVEEKVQELYEC